VTDVLTSVALAISGETDPDALQPVDLELARDALRAVADHLRTDQLARHATVAILALPLQARDLPEIRDARAVLTAVADHLTTERRTQELAP
jgi:hypothetical protein